jgi:hypothetical protein
VPFNGRHITLDCVTDQFDYEVPYSAKRDYHMDLQFLDGIPDSEGYDLGKLLKKKRNSSIPPANNAGSAATKKKKGLFSKLKPKSGAGSSSSPKKKKGIFKKVGGAVKKIGKRVKNINVKKVVSKINKFNPAAVALRNGVLAAMKLNVKNIAARLYWSYQTPEQAASNNIDTGKLNSLVKTRKKLESIFSTAGGKISNLEKAIRKGKEHSDKKKKKGVHGLDGMYGNDPSESLYGDLEQVLGYDIYHSENIEGLNGLDAVDGLGELGEPITLASVGAAMGVLAGIISQLKSIGNIFKGKSEGSEDFDEAANAAAENNEPVPGTTPLPDEANNATVQESIALPNNSGSATQPVQPVYDDTSNSSGDSDTEQADDTAQSEDRGTDTENDSTMSNALAKTSTAITPKDNNADKESFWQKKWVKPAAVIGGSLLLVMIAAKALGGSHEKNKSSPRNASLDGISRKRKKHKRKKKHRKLTAIALQ